MSMMIRRNKKRKTLREKQELQKQENIPANYTELELQEMTSKEIKQLAADNGYDLPLSPPASKENIISAYMEQQN